MAAVQFSIPDWIEENSRFFLPPVCNKLMHNNQLKVQFFTRIERVDFDQSGFEIRSF
jgi:hypothetical protein